MQQKIYYFLAALALIGVLGWVISSSNPKIRRATQTTTDYIIASAPLAFGDFSTGSLVGRTNTQASIPTAAGSGVADTAKEMALPVMNTTTFTYSGGDFTIPTLPVLRRDVAANSNFSVGSFLGLPKYLSLGSFRNLRLDSLAITEQVDDGYALSIDMQRGVSSLYQQSVTTTEKTPTSGTDSGAKLADAQVIAIAQHFLDAHSISTEHFGVPVILDTQGYAMPMVDALRAPYISPLVTITFPWLIEGTPVVDQGGAPYGLQVTIDTAKQQVTSVSNMTELRFTGSDYPLLTDPKTVLAVAQRGGVYATTSTGEKTVSVPLGAPVPVYMISAYQLSNDGVDYLVPALSFPISSLPSGVTLYQKNIVVPLIDSLLNVPDAVTPAVVPADGGSASSSAGSSPIADPAVGKTTSQPE